jgi:hypothetical protein
MKKTYSFALLAALLAALMPSGCSEPQIAAFGSNSEVVIITSPRAAEYAEKLKSILERDVLTVQYEEAFDVRVVATGDIRRDRTHKNIVLMDYLSPESPITDTMKRLLGSGWESFAAGDRNLKRLDDRWARGQALIVLGAPTESEMAGLLDTRADRIFAFVEQSVQQRLNRAIFYAGEQTAVTDRLAKTYGWRLRLPGGYEVDEQYASQRVIKILKDKPARMITVYWEGGQWPDMANTCVERKRMLAWEFWDEDEIVEESLQIGEGSFLGRRSIFLSGTWENAKYIIGGSFVTYCFRCEECGRNYVVDGAVFAPGLEKLPLIREIKAILSTFECCSTPGG